MVKGVVAGNFDVIHPGYIKMFQQCKENCDILIVMLHKDPSIERPEKLTPILSVDERTEMLMEFRSIDGVFTYGFEASLHSLLKHGEFNVRFLGDDYIGKPFTGDDLPIKTHYLDRNHGWSTTKFKKLIAKSL